jgi:hypothetical protein
MLIISLSIAIRSRARSCFVAIFVVSVALTTSSAAFGQVAGNGPDPPGMADDAPAAAENAGVTSKPNRAGDNPGAGYLPGYRRAMGLGLSPYAPRIPGLPAGLTIPFSAPAPTDEWTFNFWGYMSAALRVSRSTRANPTADQFAMTLHSFPRIVDAYGLFSGTNAPQGSWIDLTFEYGNRVVTSHVKISTWKPTAGADWTPLGSQNIFQEAYLTFKVPLGKVSLKWAVGAFGNTYGGLGQYDVGRYNAAIIGSPFGVGETLTAQYDLDGTHSLFIEDGLMGRLGKTPVGAPPIVSIDGSYNSSLPSAWVHHVHLGVARQAAVPLVLGLHFITNWAQDERDQQDDPRTPFLDESHRPDPRMDVYGADFRMLDNRLGNFAVAVSYANAHYATLLTGFNFFGSFNGEQMTKRFFGPRGAGTGEMFVAGAEYNLNWTRFLRYPEDFGGDGAELTTSVFADYAAVNSADPDFDGRNLVKFGVEATYRFFPWLALSGRVDHVIPNSKDSQETFDVISPKIIFKTDWLSHETITLAYTRWFYGSHTHAEFPYDFTRGQLDDDMYAFSFGMWW